MVSGAQYRYISMTLYKCRRRVSAMWRKQNFLTTAFRESRFASAGVKCAIDLGRAVGLW